ncbi:MAG: hypothetical protein GTN88_10755, partial [Gammaproteobacteria bacterium]|nr:hypothetical protein [Gammaproteobacteria bacterium]NIO25095.1 hypothetical protein [Gammaproteobacteria bacterium]NIQ26955.1 hypothetical protein [Gammaproteobacteria bacterium]NIT93646.1 hypothetical protein [Gammaproteobacteria bacterium]
AGVAAVLMASNIGWRIAGTGIATAVAALLMMPMSVLVDKPRWQGTGLAGMTTLLALFFLSLGMIWRIHRVLPGTWDEQQLLITLGSVL